MPRKEEMKKFINFFSSSFFSSSKKRKKIHNNFKHIFRFSYYMVQIEGKKIKFTLRQAFFLCSFNSFQFLSFLFCFNKILKKVFNFKKIYIFAQLVSFSLFNFLIDNNKIYIYTYLNRGNAFLLCIRAKRAHIAPALLSQNSLA
jgi:hypothetical protein